MRTRAPTVGVMGSSSDDHDDLARPLGVLLAGLGVHLLTGGGRGVMAAVSRAFVQTQGRRGVCVGVLPCAGEQERGKVQEGYPNPFVELPIRTHLPYSGSQGTSDLSRNHINVLSSDVIVVLPGAEGTASEVTLALRYRKPILGYARDIRLLRALPESIPRATTLDEVRRFLEQHLTPAG